MSSDAYSDFFRRRTIGRAPSPPTWACYEQIPYEDDYSDSASDSCSEDDEDYAPGRTVPVHDSDSEADSSLGGRQEPELPPNSQSSRPDGDIEIDDGDAALSEDKLAELKLSRDVKGKQRAMEPVIVNESPKRQHRRKHREPSYTLRPILTIQRSQGFVWNQVSTPPLCLQSFMPR